MCACVLIWKYDVDYILPVCAWPPTHVTYLCGLYDNRECVISGGSKRRGAESRGGQARRGRGEERRGIVSELPLSLPLTCK